MPTFQSFLMLWLLLQSHEELHAFQLDLQASEACLPSHLATLLLVQDTHL